MIINTVYITVNRLGAITATVYCVMHLMALDHCCQKLSFDKVKQSVHSTILVALYWWNCYEYWSTQPGHPSMGRHNAYQKKGSDALRPGNSDRYGSCSVAGKTV